MLGADTDAEWLDHATLGDLYAGCMVVSLRPALAISDVGWLLVYLRDHVGLEAEVCDRLVFGDPLRSLLDDLPRNDLTLAVEGDLTGGVGGWLSSQSAHALWEKIRDMEREFAAVPDSFVAEYRAAFGGDHSAAISRTRKWLREITGMLDQVGVDPETALRIVAP